MPSVDRIVEVLIQDALGSHLSTGALLDPPTAVPSSVVDNMEDAARFLLCRFVAAVDWARVLRDAADRHDRMHSGESSDEPRCSPFTDVCGACLEEALFVEDVGAAQWSEYNLPRPREVDWPRAVADAVPFRENAVWHPFQESAPGAGPA